MNTTSIENIIPLAKPAVLVRFETRRRHSRMPRVASGRAWLKRARPIITENLLCDIDDCAEWAEQNNIPVRDPRENILFVLTRENVQKHLSKAVAILNADGVDTSGVWSVDDLLSPANFEFIAQYADYDFIRAIVQIAMDWVRVPTEALASLEEVVRKNIYF
jgi:hypothetical protein